MGLMGSHCCPLLCGKGGEDGVGGVVVKMGLVGFHCCSLLCCKGGEDGVGGVSLLSFAVW